MVAAGRKDGVAVDDPVVTQDGLVGKVTRVSPARARVTLLTDDASAVSALDVETKAVGIVRRGQGPRAPLRLDRVPKEQRVRSGDTIVTAGLAARRGSRRSTRAGSRSAGSRASGSTDTDLYKQVQVEPFADLELARRGARARPGRPRRRARRERRAPRRAARLRRRDRAGHRARRRAHPRGRARPAARHVVCIALAAGSIAGAVAGFAGGLLVDVMTLGTLGTTSLVLTLAGYWAGRYGETTGRGRALRRAARRVRRSRSSPASAASRSTSCSASRSPRATRSSTAVPSAILAAVLALGVSSHRRRDPRSRPEGSSAPRQVELV